MAAYHWVYDSLTHITCRLTAKNRDRPLNPTLGNQVWATFIFLAINDVQHELELLQGNVNTYIHRVTVT